MDFKKSKRLLIVVAIIYWVFAIGIYAIANEQFRFSSATSNAPSSELITGEITDERSVSQEIYAPADVISAVEILAGTYDRENSGDLTVTLMDEAKTVLAEKTIALSEIENNAYTSISFDHEIPAMKDKLCILKFSTQGCTVGNAITFFAGTALPENTFASNYTINGEEGFGALCTRLNGYNYLSFYKTYWVIIVIAFLLVAAYTAHCWKEAKKGKSNPLVSVCAVYTRYGFLIKQLISRDFKTKYKRSALGMAWSFMNPLLTMSVQYIVFSTLFKSDIPNYPVYLLTGIVFFSFFSEALSLGMSSITGNAALIKKVYMPKYIYPISRILSSLVNFAFALIPLLLMMLLTGTAFTPSIFLLAFDILCYLAFIIGMTLLLTTAMTFFQDTQFLWGIVSMMWQYLTPIFYPETIIPENILPLYRLNPLYQFISFARICIIKGVSPAPSAYFHCLISAALVLFLGIFVFKKQQNKFVLYL